MTETETPKLPPLDFQKLREARSQIQTKTPHQPFQEGQERHIRLLVESELPQHLALNKNFMAFTSKTAPLTNIPKDESPQLHWLIRDAFYREQLYSYLDEYTKEKSAETWTLLAFGDINIMRSRDGFERKTQQTQFQSIHQEISGGIPEPTGPRQGFMSKVANGLLGKNGGQQ